MHHLWLQFLHITGVDDVSGRWYAWWSGFAGDITLLAAILAAPWIQWKRASCGVRRCWRLARHDFTDPQTKIIHHLCRLHHPEHPGKPITAQELQARYRLYLGKRPGRG